MQFNNKYERRVTCKYNLVHPEEKVNIYQDKHKKELTQLYIFKICIPLSSLKYKYLFITR